MRYLWKVLTLKLYEDTLSELSSRPYTPVAEEGVVCLVAVASCSVMIGVNCQDQGHSVPSVPAHTVAIM